jgi:hypothetical protein
VDLGGLRPPASTLLDAQGPLVGHVVVDPPVHQDHPRGTLGLLAGMGEVVGLNSQPPGGECSRKASGSLDGDMQRNRIRLAPPQPVGAYEAAREVDVFAGMQIGRTEQVVNVRMDVGEWSGSSSWREQSLPECPGRHVSPKPGDHPGDRQPEEEDQHPDPYGNGDEPHPDHRAEQEKPQND